METIDHFAELAAAIKRQRALAALARADLESAITILTAAIGHQSGQSAKVESILWSVWNGELCDALAGLDSCLTESVIAVIAGRAYLSGDADELLRRIITDSGSQPPAITRRSDS